MKSRRWTLPWGVGFTMLIHGAVVGGVAIFGPPTPPARPMPPVRVRLVAPPPKAVPPPPVEITPPPPKELPPPPPPPKEKAPPLPKERVPPPKEKAPPPPKEQVPPPPPKAPDVPPPPPVPEPPVLEPPEAPDPRPTEPTPPPAPPPSGRAPPKRSFSANMEANQQGGSVQVPRGGGNTGGDPRGGSGADDRGSPGDSEGSGRGSGRGSGAGSASGSPASNKPVDAASVTSLPGLLSRPSDDEMRDAYPEAARQKGLDANVGLEILVDGKGRVVSVRVTKPAGEGFDEVATRLLKRHRFRPARKDGQPVSVWIPWTYKFRLGD